MGLFQKKNDDPCPLCGSKYSFANSKFSINSGENICTKCVILISGLLKNDQQKLKSKSLNEIRKLYTFEQEQAIQSKDDFNPSRAVANTIEVDEGKRKLRPVGDYYKRDIVSIDSIKSFEIIQNGQSISSGSLGRAVVGGVLFGGAGAVVGALTGRKSKTKITELRIKLTIDDINNSVFYIPILAKEVYSDTADYHVAAQAAEEVISTIDIMLSKNQAPEGQTSSAADEIRKYKELMDDGIISIEEFEVKKKELLNL